MEMYWLPQHADQAAAPTPSGNMHAISDGRTTQLPVGPPPQSSPYPVDQHAAFRLTFRTTSPNTKVTLQHSGASWYNVFLDGLPVAEGPTRFTGMTPYCAGTAATIDAVGAHVVAIHAHSIGLGSRILNQTPPFVCCTITSVDPAKQPLVDENGAVNVQPMWSCRALSGGSATSWYKPQWARMSGLLGWMENCRIDSTLLSWKNVDYAADAKDWLKPVTADPKLRPPVPLAMTAAPASSRSGALPQMAEGTLCERYGYANDDPPARFILRTLVTSSCDERETAPPLTPDGLDLGAAQGKWWRYDSGKAQLLRPVLQMAGCPAGTMIEICYCQALIDGKASPYHPLCGTASCYMDRYTIGADIANKAFTICPLEPRGCRYVEVHVTRDDDPTELTNAQVTKATALYRCYDSYHVPPSGSFQAAEETGSWWWGAKPENAELPSLAKIWNVGAESTRSCCEDSCIDGPCRERGMWLGDTAAVTLPNLAFMYDDLGPIRLMLQQTAAKADVHGVFSGNCPSGGGIADYALLWLEALSMYLNTTGDKDAVAALWPACTKCVDYFLSSACYSDAAGFAPKGLSKVIDWGYVPSKAFGDFEICLNGLLITALQAVVNVGTVLGDTAAATKYASKMAKHVALVKRTIGLSSEGSKDMDETGEGWVVVQGDSGFKVTNLGMHGAAFLLRAGVFGPDNSNPQKQATIQYIKQQLEQCFPINAGAPRLSDPSKRSPTGFYTPYFQTFTFMGLFEQAAEADWCLSQYKKAWGWALTQANTWLEVFDPRWEVVCCTKHTVTPHSACSTN